MEDTKKNFPYSKRYYYCGESIDGYPVEISEKNVRMEYMHRETGRKMHLDLYPFRREELTGLMEVGGLKVIESYGDFRLNRTDGVDFYQLVGRKVR